MTDLTQAEFLALPAEDRRRLIDDILVSRETSATDFLSFCRMQGYEPARHHRLIIEKLQEIADRKLKRLMIFAPPGSAKTTYSTMLFPPFMMGRYPGQSIVCSSHSGQLAEYFSYRARAIVGGESWHSVFEEGLPVDARAVSYWRTTAGSEYFAIGVGGGVTGRRADGFIIDDPVSGFEAANSPTQSEATWNWYLTEARTRRKDSNFWIVLILTRWATNDLAGRILPDKWDGEYGEVIARDGEPWFVIRLPVEAEENDQLGRAVGEPLWPEQMDAAQIAIEKKHGPHRFSALYQQRPIPLKGSEFRLDWMKYYKREELSPDRIARMTRIIVADPAHSRKVNADRTAMWCLGLAEDGNYYVLDIVADRLSLTQKGDALFAMHRKFRPVRTGWERYGMQSDIEHFEDRMARDGYRFHITELKGPQRKEDRIRRLVPVFENRRLYFPETLYKTLADGSYEDMVQMFLSEFLKFPSGAFDDMLDALSRMMDSEMNLRYETTVQAVNYRPIVQRTADEDGLYF